MGVLERDALKQGCKREIAHYLTLHIPWEVKERYLRHFLLYCSAGKCPQSQHCTFDPLPLISLSAYDNDLACIRVK
jgi:hypothetical protein